MKRFIVLGSSGMLGSEVSRVSKQKNLNLLEISRGGEISFDAESESFDDFAKRLNLNSDDWLVNCVGWIPQKATNDAKENIRLSTLLNTKLPEEISQSREKLRFNWIQIATDCAFKGDKGSYQEGNPKDGADLYGVSKIAGEKLSRGAMQIRCSIVGPDKKTNSGLYSWFKRAIKDGTVKGFSNHRWNGVTSTAFARLAVAIFENELRTPLDQHWVPKDQVSKYELLQLFAAEWGYDKSLVQNFQTETSIDRTLATGNQDSNKRLWKLAGYESIPSIEALCQEFIEIDKQLG